ncbi:MAG: arginine deiminase-related protein [Bacteroidota bacterium]
MSKQITGSVLMVRPSDFTFNAETAVDNEFQNKPEGDVTATVLAEFAESVALLRAEGIKVSVQEKILGLPQLPDAVFPNNWFSTRPDGTVFMFPMHTTNRRAERLQFPHVDQLLAANGHSLSRVLTLLDDNAEGNALEGTGSMVIDHEEGIVYAAVSIRTDPEKLMQYCKLTGTRPLPFRTESSTGKPFYHTNVVLSIGPGFAVICADCIRDTKEKNDVLTALRKNHEVIEISLEQAETGFCANILTLEKPDGNSLIVMSVRAFEGFTEAQKGTLNKYGKLLALPIPTIEHIGGGSARCMMAEVFLPEER